MADFERILDDAHVGPEPTESYKSSLAMLDNVVRDSMNVSCGFGGIPSPTAKHYYASVLFTALIARAVTLVNLAPHSEWSSKIIEHWDYASAAVVTRTMLEIRLAFYYLCIDRCDDVQWNCRWNIFNLHDCTSRRKLFEAMEDVRQVGSFDEQAEELKSRLRSNSYFQQLSASEQKKYLNGQQAYMEPLEVIAEKAGLERKFFRMQYVLLSSHVHGLPMSFYRIAPGNPDRGRGLPSTVEEDYTAMCLSLAATLLAATRDEVRDLFSGIEPKTFGQSHSGASFDPASVVEQTSVMAVGEPVKMMETDLLSVEVVKKNEDLFEIVYRYKPTGAAVLIRHESSAEGAELHDIDPMFWTVRLNGKPVPEAVLLALTPGNYAFKVDHKSFSIDFKVAEDVNEH